MWIVYEGHKRARKAVKRMKDMFYVKQASALASQQFFFGFHEKAFEQHQKLIDIKGILQKEALAKDNEIEHIRDILKAKDLKAQILRNIIEDSQSEVSILSSTLFYKRADESAESAKLDILARHARNVKRTYIQSEKELEHFLLRQSDKLVPFGFAGNSARMVKNIYKKQVDDARIQADSARKKYKIAETDLAQSNEILEQNKIEVEIAKKKYAEADEKLTCLLDEFVAVEREMENIYETFKKKKKSLSSVEMQLANIVEDEKSLEENLNEEREQRDTKQKAAKEAENALRVTEDTEVRYDNTIHKLGNSINELKAIREELIEEEFVCAESLAYYVLNTVKEFVSKHLVGTDVSEQEKEAFALLEVFIFADEHAEQWAQSRVIRPSDYIVQWLAVVLMRFYVAQRRFDIASFQFESDRAKLYNARETPSTDTLPFYIASRERFCVENALFESEEKRYLDERNIIEIAVGSVPERQDVNTIEIQPIEESSVFEI
jgi:hypothetical protein